MIIDSHGHTSLPDAIYAYKALLLSHPGAHGRGAPKISDEELTARRRALQQAGGYPVPPHQTPWQEIQRALVGQADGGGVLESGTKYQRLAQTVGTPRHSH